jgi:hypothetical protein
MAGRPKINFEHPSSARTRAHSDSNNSSMVRQFDRLSAPPAPPRPAPSCLPQIGQQLFCLHTIFSCPTWGRWPIGRWGLYALPSNASASRLSNNPSMVRQAHHSACLPASDMRPRRPSTLRQAQCAARATTPANSACKLSGGIGIGIGLTMPIFIFALAVSGACALNTGFQCFITN